jgi:hypothetical protein
MLIKEILKRGAKGAIIGVFLIQTIGVIMMFSSNEVGSFDKEFLISQYVSGAVTGFAFGCFNILFQSDRLGIIGATLIHFVGVLAVYIACVFRTDWFRADDAVLLSTIVIFVFVYFIIWLTCYLQWKKDVNAMNMKLNLRRGK